MYNLTVQASGMMSQIDPNDLVKILIDVYNCFYVNNGKRGPGGKPVSKPVKKGSHLVNLKRVSPIEFTPVGVGSAFTVKAGGLCGEPIPMSHPIGGDMYHKIIPNFCIDKEEFKKVLRARGYAIDEEDNDEGVKDSDKVIMAKALSGSKEEINDFNANSVPLDMDTVEVGLALLGIERDTDYIPELTFDKVEPEPFVAPKGMSRMQAIIEKSNYLKKEQKRVDLINKRKEEEMIKNKDNILKQRVYFKNQSGEHHYLPASKKELTLNTFIPFLNNFGVSIKKFMLEGLGISIGNYKEELASSATFQYNFAIKKSYVQCLMLLKKASRNTMLRK